jgi:hypothetical protein
MPSLPAPVSASGGLHGYLKVTAGENSKNRIAERPPFQGNPAILFSLGRIEDPWLSGLRLPGVWHFPFGDDDFGGLRSSIFCIRLCEKLRLDLFAKKQNLFAIHGWRDLRWRRARHPICTILH